VQRASNPPCNGRATACNGACHPPPYTPCAWHRTHGRCTPGVRGNARGFFLGLSQPADGRMAHVVATRYVDQSLAGIASSKASSGEG
jgi:hypothetical protein